MKKVLLTLGIIILILGIGCVIGGFAMNDWEMVSVSYEKKEYASEYKDYTDIVIDTDHIDVTILYGEKLHISYFESEYNTFQITDEGDKKLVIEETYENKIFKWFSFGGIFGGDNIQLVLTIPTSEVVPNVDVQSSVGEVKLNGNYQKVDVKNHVGNIEYENGTVETATFKTSNGIITLDSVTATGDSGKIEAASTNGVIKISNSTAKAGITASSTNGKVELLSCSTEGVMNASTTNGNVLLELALFKTGVFKTTNGKISGSILGNQNEFTINCSTTNGSASPANQSPAGAKYSLNATTTNGQISFTFVAK